MDLNLPPPDTDPAGYAPPHNSVGSVHPPTNHEDEHISKYQKIPDVMPGWLARLATKSNPHRALEQFQKLNPPAFKGEADPIQAEEWLRRIEKILTVMECNENQKVSFTSFMFQGEAEHWWDMVKGGANSLREKVSWNFLVKKFNEKYIPGVAKDKLALEFQELKQGQMSVNQYDVKFTQLSRYAAGLVREESERTKRFVRGLKPEIRSKLIPFQLQIYIQAVEKALEVERDILEDQEVKSKELPPSKRPHYQETPDPDMSNHRFNRSEGSSVASASRSNGGTWHRVGFPRRPQTILSHRPDVAGNSWCPICHLNHAGSCVLGKQCFSCGQMGHIRKECPILQGHPSTGFGTERRTGGTAHFSGSTGTFRRPFNTPRPAETQSSVQQPGARRERNA